ncbi:MAG: DUF5615 family PIN-like protein [Acidobacteria bacterium]|nr:DUF5615 family PIN-like protein [Acidobacteriota bacterium]
MILADHCVFASTVRLLQDAGYSVTRLKELTSPDVPDREVLELAARWDLVLLTNDADFGNILMYPPAQHEGIILLKIRAELETQVHSVLLRLLAQRSRDGLRHRLALVDRAKYRIRG